MSFILFLTKALANGVHRIGQVEIHVSNSGNGILLFHEADKEKVLADCHEGFEVFDSPDDAREISTYSDTGEYRFSKSRLDLRTGWLLRLSSLKDVWRALDLLYPAALGVLAAQEKGVLEVQNLRDKLNRQTGMYRSTRNLSDAGAQQLVRQVCGPSHNCAKRILWQLDEHTPLIDSEASQYGGIPGEVAENEAFPLLCREACNHFVAESRKAVKAEAARSASS